MSSAGVIAHCLTPNPSVNTWVYDLRVGTEDNTSEGALVWDPVRERFFCLITGISADTSQLISSPDGRPPWRVDHVFTEASQYSSEPRSLVIHPTSGRLVTSVTQGNSGGNTVGQYFLYSDNLTSWLVSPTLATTTSKQNRMAWTGHRYIAFGNTSTTAHRTTDSSLSAVEACSPGSTSGNLGGMLVWDNGGITDQRVILAINGDSFLGIDGKILYSDDGGSTWNTSAWNSADPNPQSGYTGIVTDGTTIRAYKFISSSLYRYDSVDGGLTFTPFAVSGGTTSNTPAKEVSYYGGIWYGPGILSTSPEILSSTTGLRPFTREDITQWPDINWGAQATRIAHNDNISVCFGISDTGTPDNTGWLAYKYRI